MKIAVIGTGYVGLVSGVCFSDFGNDVICIDNNVDKINDLKNGIIPIYEPGLKDLVKKNSASGRLSFSTSIKDIAYADVVFLAVGTPPNPDGSANLEYIFNASKEIAPLIQRYTVIVVKSTVPVGTGDDITKLIKSINPRADFSVVSNPEFLREGCAIQDFKHPDRIIIGLDDDRARVLMSNIYQSLHFDNVPIFFTSRRSSELIKYAANAFLAMKVTYINEIANLCEVVGGNIDDVAYGIGLDSRIGSTFLKAGPGYGGSCFPKDTSALTDIARKYKKNIGLIEKTIEINEQRTGDMVEKIQNALDQKSHDVEGKKIAVLGLAFKPNTDDVRDSPAINIINELYYQGADIRCTDPKAMQNAKPVLKDVKFFDSVYKCAKGSDCLVIATDWDQYKHLDFVHLKELMNDPILIDLRNVYKRNDVEKHGFTYISVGR